MKKSSPNISNMTMAYNGAVIAVAAVLAYSILVMIYTIIRSSVTIYSIMPKGERNNILLVNGISVAYSVTIFSLIMATLSSIVGSVAAIVLKKLLQRFNPDFSLKKAILISCITAFAIVMFIYLLLHALLKDWMTFDYAETFTFWFLFPAIILIVVCIISGHKLNQILNTRFHH